MLWFLKGNMRSNQIDITLYIKKDKEIKIGLFVIYEGSFWVVAVGWLEPIYHKLTSNTYSNLYCGLMKGKVIELLTVTASARVKK